MPQFAQHPSAEIESDAGGFFLLPSVVSGEPLFENTRQILWTDANACVPNGQGLGGVLPGDGDTTLFRRVFQGVREELTDDKGQPLLIGEHLGVGFV